MTTTALFAADEKPRPSGLPLPPSPDLRAIFDTISSERFNEALEALFGFTPQNLDEVIWTRYLRGLAMFGNEEYEAGLDEFNFVLAHTDALDRSEDHRNSFRVAGLCLKKLGWYYRNQKDHGQAVRFHERRYDLSERYGSYEELHDAAISLDVDYYYLNDSLRSEEWLRRSIAAGEKIPDEHARDRALGISWNNLSGALCSLKRFEEAESAATSSLRHWAAWEQAEGHTKEHREVWAYFGLAEVYRQWADALANKLKREQARAEFEQALRLGREQGMSEEDTKLIQHRFGS